MKKIIYLITFLITFCTYSQSYIKGKIFIKGDTSYGLIKERVDKKNASSCLFKGDSKAKAVIYFPSQIEGYELENRKEIYI